MNIKKVQKNMKLTEIDIFIGLNTVLDKFGGEKSESEVKNDLREWYCGATGPWMRIFGVFDIFQLFSGHLRVKYVILPTTITKGIFQDISVIYFIYIWYKKPRFSNQDRA